MLSTLERTLARGISEGVMQFITTLIIMKRSFSEFFQGMQPLCVYVAGSRQEGAPQFTRNYIVPTLLSLYKRFILPSIMCTCMSLYM